MFSTYYDYVNIYSSSMWQIVGTFPVWLPWNYFIKKIICSQTLREVLIPSMIKHIKQNFIFTFIGYIPPGSLFFLLLDWWLRNPQFSSVQFSRSCLRLCHSGQYFLDVHFGQQRPLEGCSGGRRVVLARGCPRPVGKVPWKCPQRFPWWSSS